jgi:hypothetical protein
MGELLDRLNEIDPHPHAPGEPIKSHAAQTAEFFRSAGQRVNDIIEAIQEPGMPLDTLAKAAREVPLAALGIAFMLGVVFARPRR